MYISPCPIPRGRRRRVFAAGSIVPDYRWVSIMGGWRICKGWKKEGKGANEKYVPGGLLRFNYPAMWGLSGSGWGARLICWLVQSGGRGGGVRGEDGKGRTSKSLTSIPGSVQSFFSFRAWWWRVIEHRFCSLKVEIFVFLFFYSWLCMVHYESWCSGAPKELRCRDSLWPKL